MLNSWRCKCPDKINAMGLPRCRKCGAGRPSYSTDGQSIIITRETPATALKRRNRGKSDDLPKPEEPRRESFIESTLKFIDDKGQDNGDD